MTEYEEAMDELGSEIEELLENELADDMMPPDPAWVALWIMDLVRPVVSRFRSEQVPPG